MFLLAVVKNRMLRTSVQYLNRRYIMSNEAIQTTLEDTHVLGSQESNDESQFVMPSSVIEILEEPVAEQSSILDGVGNSNLEELKEESGRTLEDFIGDGLQELLDAPPEPLTEIISKEQPQQKRRQRKRKGENIRPTPLQMRYQRQLRDYRTNNPELVDSLSKLVAWTWIPGKDRLECPPVVDFREPRLLVMDRSTLEEDGPSAKIGLTMYRTTITNQGVVVYADPDNVEMFKDFSIRPHFRAGGLCLDSRNEEVFRTALALDSTMECVARSKLDPITCFSPPPCLFGFPRHFIPHPEWRVPMQDAVLKALHPDSTTMRCLLSPGGLICDVIEHSNSFRTINMEQSGNLIQISLPNWVILNDNTKKGNTIQKDYPLADLPRGNFDRIKDVTQKYPFSGLDWLERRIMDELTEILSVEEEVYDKQTQQRKRMTTTWCCVPSRFVQTQMSRVVRFFLDFRKHLGRKIHTIDSFENDLWTVQQKQARIEVAQFNECPTVKDLQFDDSVDDKNGSFYADLLSTSAGGAWLPPTVS
jgi:hypothetical protein